MNWTKDARIAVVCGGTSREASVSRMSGREVAAALHAHYHDVSLLELEPDIAQVLRRRQIDVVFPAVHGSPGEDGTLQGLLETMQIPFVGSGVAASVLAMNKPLAKMIFRSRGIPVAADVVVDRNGQNGGRARALMSRLGPNLVVKPATQGSALGITLTQDESTLREALELAFEFDARVLVEQYVPGTEVTVGILDLATPQALPPVAIQTPPDSWYDYVHRYVVGLSQHIVPAPIPSSRGRYIEQMALAAHLALGCRDLSRADFIVPRRGRPVLLEVNTLPGMTPTSLYPDAARAGGHAFQDLVRILVEQALHRSVRRPVAAQMVR
ncbi:MAG: D-alanine--D-alanine ligase [Gammaproteobacteria bacterium]|nr:D-alanine--D-alanine ligase [Gammaproteobacteria bacterium]